MLLLYSSITYAYENLSIWEQQGDPVNGNWEFTPGNNETVVQLINGNPTFYVSPTEFINGKISGYFKTDNAQDDDYMGFVLGYKSPLAVNGDSYTDYDFILFDWQNGNKGPNALPGKYLHYVDNSAADLWTHDNMTQLGYSSGTWTAGQQYYFECSYTTQNITISINNTLVFSVDASTVPAINEFWEGRFGFYNYSQGPVSYGDFTDVPPNILCTGKKRVLRDRNQQGVTVDPGVLVTGKNPEYASVFISNNFQQGEDYLSFDTTLATSLGISGIYDNATGILSLNGGSDADDYTQVLQTVRYDNVSNWLYEPDRTITFQLGDSTSEYNNHYYQYISDPAISWSDARDACDSKRLLSLKGYLATITSAEENMFINDIIPGNSWIGASDESIENEWKWVTGPESNTQFWQGQGSAAGGYAVGGNYSNWNGTEEPNNSNGEDYGHMRSSGTWNDFPNNQASITGYVVEYGGMPGDPELNITDYGYITFGHPDAQIFGTNF